MFLHTKSMPLKCVIYTHYRLYILESKLRE